MADTNKIAIIAGAGPGLGHALCRKLLAEATQLPGFRAALRQIPRCLPMPVFLLCHVM